MPGQAIMQLADGKKFYCTNEFVQVQVDVGGCGVLTTMVCCVIPVSEELIIGMTWLQAHEALVHCRSLPGMEYQCDGKHIRVTGEQGLQVISTTRAAQAAKVIISVHEINHLLSSDQGREQIEQMFLAVVQSKPASGSAQDQAASEDRDA
ncbi:hypothetical protein GGH97_004087, partial [Coemansia sp. RSA 475]